MRQAAILTCALALLALPGAWGQDAPVKHRFLAVDESRGKLHYVDEFEPAKGWSITFPARYRDVQLAGGGRVLVSAASGYAEKAWRIAREFNCDRLEWDHGGITVTVTAQKSNARADAPRASSGSVGRVVGSSE